MNKEPIGNSAENREFEAEFAQLSDRLPLLHDYYYNIKDVSARREEFSKLIYDSLRMKQKDLNEEELSALAQMYMIKLETLASKT